MLTVTERQGALELIERAQRSTATCTCGQPLLTTGTGYELYLECPVRQSPPTGRVGRLLGSMVQAVHTRQLIVDLLPAA